MSAMLEQQLRASIAADDRERGRGPRLIGEILGRMAANPDVNPMFRRALLEARSLDDVADSFVDGHAMDIIEGRTR